jgi:hypothetical protein
MQEFQTAAAFQPIHSSMRSAVNTCLRKRLATHCPEKHLDHLTVTVSCSCGVLLNALGRCRVFKPLPISADSFFNAIFSLNARLRESRSTLSQKYIDHLTATGPRSGVSTFLYWKDVGI